MATHIHLIKWRMEKVFICCVYLVTGGCFDEQEDNEEIEMATPSAASSDKPAATQSQPPDNSTNVTSDDLEDLANNPLS